MDAFFQRYLRWSVIHRTAVSPSTYVAQALLNPVPLAVLGVLLHPTALTACAAMTVALGKVCVDVAVFRALRPQPVAARAAAAVLVKDALLFAAWWHGAFRRTVDWRGTRLRVVSGTRLVPLRARTSPSEAWITGNEAG